MKVNDIVKIINIDKMWDKEIYYMGWGLSQSDDIKNKENCVPPSFQENRSFKNGYEALIVESGLDDLGWQYMLQISMIDDNGVDWVCHSQYYDIDELKQFCEIIS